MISETGKIIRKKRGPAAVYVSDSAKKRRKRERDNLWNKRRVNLATSHEQWIRFKEKHELQTHEAVACVLLDSFDK
jgi:hypothetical protein